MNTSPRVSVIVASRNRPQMLQQALESLRCQTLKDFEVLVIDDGSDDPHAVAAAMPRDCRFRLFRNERCEGPSGARNRGLDLARGEFIAVLDDDDLAVRDRLEKQLNILEQYPDDVGTFSAVQWFRGEREPLSVFPGVVAEGRWPERPEDVFRLMYLWGSKVPNTTIMLRRSLLRGLRYPEWTRIGEDWFLFLQMAALGMRMTPIREALVWVRRDPNCESLVQLRKERQEAELMVLRRVRAWLEEIGDFRFVELHSLAVSNAYARQALWVSRFRGLGLAARSILEKPTNPYAWASMQAILDKAARRLTRARLHTI